jgi:hypothetical protein
VEHIKQIKDHFLLPEVVEECRLRGCISLRTALRSVLHPPATPSSDATVPDVDVTEAINFFRAARAAEAGKQPVCVSDLFSDGIRDSPHCATLLAAIRQGLSTQLPGCRSTPPLFFFISINVSHGFCSVVYSHTIVMLNEFAFKRLAK